MYEVWQLYSIFPAHLRKCFLMLISGKGVTSQRFSGEKPQFYHRVISLTWPVQLAIPLTECTPMASDPWPQISQASTLPSAIPAHLTCRSKHARAELAIIGILNDYANFYLKIISNQFYEKMLISGISIVEQTPRILKDFNNHY